MGKTHFDCIGLGLSISLLFGFVPMVLLDGVDEFMRALPIPPGLQRRSFTPRTQITSTTPAMGRKKVIGHTDVLGMVPLSASLSCGRYPKELLL